YQPPANLTPGGIGTLVDERVDPIDITSTVVDLAVRGHLTIRTVNEDRLFGLMTSEETVFERVADAPGKLLAHEREVLAGLFPGGGTSVRASDLKNKFYRHIPKIKTALYAQLTTQGYFDRSP